MFKTICLFIVLLSAKVSTAQQFIDKAVIEYEMKANIQKTMGNNTWDEMLKAALPTFKTGYFTFTFSDNKSIYKFDRWAPGPKMPEWLRRSDEENIWYFDHNNNRSSILKSVSGTSLNVDDTIPALQWKLVPNENRIIAGFNCRKAVTKIFDSVYVFAFYTDEILISGGPCSINGLPGMILGVTIPRLYTSWIATKVMINNVQENSIKPLTGKKTFTYSTLKNTLLERVSDWRPENDEAKQQKNRFIWTTML